MNLLFKTTGIILILAASTIMGLCFSARLQTRKRRLKEFIILITELKDRIFYECSEVNTLVKKIFKGKELLEFDGNKFFISKGVFLEEELKILNDFFNKLGTTEMQGEINRAELCIKLLNEQYEKISKTVDEKAKLYRILGMSAGILVSVMLI